MKTFPSALNVHRAGELTTVADESRGAPALDDRNAMEMLHWWRDWELITTIDLC
jgi:hypothetical protein